MRPLTKSCPPAILLGLAQLLLVLHQHGALAQVPSERRTWSPNGTTVAIIAPTIAQPPKGFRWEGAIPLAVTASDTDLVTVEHLDENGNVTDVTQYYTGSNIDVMVTCSWGSFLQTGLPEASGYLELDWTTGGDVPQATVEFTVTVFDDDMLPFGDFGSRADADLTGDNGCDIRYPASITVSHRLHDPNVDPPLDFGEFGYYNIVKVLDNHGDPFELVGAAQFRADPALSRHSHQTTPEINHWQLDLQTIATDENGVLKDLVQGDSRMDLEDSDSHEYKRVFTMPIPPDLEKRYWNPSPFTACTASHGTGSYGSIP